MIRAPSRDWRVILLAVVGGAGAFLCLGLSAAIAGYVLLGSWLRPLASKPFATEDPTGKLILAGGLVLIAGVLIATLMAALATLSGRTEPKVEYKLIRRWAMLVWIVAWLGASALAQVFNEYQFGTWAIPFLHLLAIAGPIYVLSRLAIGGIRGGSRLRLWGSMTSGMLLGTGLAGALELVLLLVAIAAGGVYLIANPSQLIALQKLATELAGMAKPEELLGVLGPVLMSPFVLMLALAAVAVATPLVEEFAKSIPVWVLHDRISTGAQGFWVGALSGAGFALFEGIMVSSSVDEDLGFILVLRAGSSLMHIISSGLAGWGIAVFRTTGRPAHMLAGYAAAMGLHSLWNGLVATIGYAAIRTAYGAVQPDLAAMALSVSGVTMLVLLFGLLPIALVLLNLRFRSVEATPAGVGFAGGAAHSAPGLEEAREVP